MRTFLQDLRFGARVLLNHSGFALVAVLTLALGIAANTAVFSWIDSVLLRPIPGAADPGRLAAFETVTPNGEFVTTSYLDFRDYRDHLKLLDGLAIAQPRAFALGDETRSERIWGELVSGNYFAVLGVKPLHGRTFSAGEAGDRQGAYPVAVISESLWRRRFHADAGILGQTIRINRQQLTVIGVVPGDFRGSVPGLSFEIWAPAMMGHTLNFMPDWMLDDRQTRSFIAVARLKSGVTLEQARTEIKAISAELGARFPKTNRGITATLFPVWQGHFGAQSLLLSPLRILMAVCLLVLVIVCANVANLLLARSSARRKEFSLRISLGAGRFRLVRQLLTETLLLGFLATLVGVPLAFWMSQSLALLLPATTLPVVMEARMNVNILLFTLLICLAACLIAGLAPALNAVRADVAEALKEGGRGGSAGTGARRIRGVLVAAEVALALVALIGAGLFTRSFREARRIHPGFDPEKVGVAQLHLSTAGYSVPQRIQFCRTLRERLESQPGIVAASYADSVPLGFEGGSWEDLKIEGYVPSPSENMKIARNVVAPGYFGLLKIPLLDGRDFNELDDQKAARVMIVNETFARRFTAGRSPIGYKVYGWGQWFQVVGVARDSKYNTPNEAAKPYFYVPFRQVYRVDLGIAFYLRTAGDVNQALAALRREAAAIDPNAGVFDAMPMTEFITASLFGQRVAAALLAALGAMAMLLAGVGLYSVISYSISQRVQEIGIRMALGASAWDVLGLVVRQGMGMTAAGLLAGAAVALAVTRLAGGMLVGVSPADPLVFAGSAAFLALVALAASYIPALRAARIDPNVALRSQ